MAVPTADRRASLDREISLRRSFFAIHRPSIDPGTPPRLATPDSEHHKHLVGSNTDAQYLSPLPRLQRSNHRRATIPGGSAAPLRRRHERDIAPSFESFPKLPFSKADDEPQAQQEQRDISAKKFQRRYSPIKADMSQEMVFHLALEKQMQQVSMMNNAPAYQAFKADANQLRRRKSVTFEPLASNARPEDRPRSRAHKGFRSDYSLGETCRSPAHMIEAPASPREALSAVESLNKHDFAFVRRSDGSFSFSYAILACLSFVPIKAKSAKPESIIDKEECMTFVMCDAGSTKMVRRRNYAEFVRLAASYEGSDVVPHVADAVPARRPASPRSQEQQEFENSGKCS